MIVDDHRVSDDSSRSRRSLPVLNGAHTPESAHRGALADVSDDRRAFLRRAVLGAGGLAALFGTGSAVAAEVPRVEVASLLDGPEDLPVNHLDRMLLDLERALAKPVEQRKWVMVIDLQKCTGCKSCTVSCVAENNLPPGVVYRPVIEEEIGEFPDVRKRFTPRPCMQCENPPCTPVCPVSATYKRPDGIVAIDYDVCIGCRYCIAACPYNARTADFGDFYNQDSPEIMDYETRPNFEYGKEWQREPGRGDSPIGNARKCHFCLHRIENGILPACVTTCLGAATYFGDYNDEKSLVHSLVGSTRVMRLKEELGTEPKVYYLV